MHKLSAVIVLLALLFVPVRSDAQTPDDETRIRDLATRWEKAWNRHDIKSLATLLTVDADFVNVAGRHWKGRSEIEAAHTERLPQFKDSTWTTKKVTVQFIRPDVALVHVDWGIVGDTDPDGTARKPRDGVFSWIAVKTDARWLIRSVQNTNINNPPIVSK